MYTHVCVLAPASASASAHSRLHAAPPCVCAGRRRFEDSLPAFLEGFRRGDQSSATFLETWLIRDLTDWMLTGATSQTKFAAGQNWTKWSDLRTKIGLVDISPMIVSKGFGGQTIGQLVIRMIG